MVIYADLLLILNVYVDALLLHRVARFLHWPLRSRRLFWAAMLGGVLGLLALLPLSGILSVGLGMAEAAAIAACAFLPCTLWLWLRATFLLLLFGAAFSGICTVLLRLFPLPNAAMLHGTLYISISPLLLIALTAVAYGVLWWFDRLFQKKAPNALFVTVTLQHGGKPCTLRAKIDTGLSLREPFSGLPVLVASRTAVQSLLPGDFSLTTPGMRAVPYRALGSRGLLPAFCPDAAYVQQKPLRCYVAVAETSLFPDDFTALLGPLDPLE